MLISANELFNEHDKRLSTSPLGRLPVSHQNSTGARVQLDLLSVALIGAERRGGTRSTKCVPRCVNKSQCWNTMTTKANLPTEGKGLLGNQLIGGKILYITFEANFVATKNTLIPNKNNPSSHTRRGSNKRRCRCCLLFPRVTLTLTFQLTSGRLRGD